MQCVIFCDMDRKSKERDKKIRPVWAYSANQSAVENEIIFLSNSRSTLSVIAYFLPWRRLEAQSASYLIRKSPV